MLRLCVWSPLGQLSTFQKDWSPAARKKRSEGEEFLFVEWMGLLIVIFVGGGGEFTKAEIFQGKTELCVWVVLRGGYGKEALLFFPPFPLIHIPVLSARVGLKSHEWRSRSRC